MTTQQRINIYTRVHPTLNWLLLKWPDQTKAKYFARRISFLFLPKARRAKGFEAWNVFLESLEL